MNKLIMIRGNSGSGKSTLAKLLQTELGENTLLISQDYIRREMLLAHDGIDSPALPLLIDLLEYGHAHCEITILEGILKESWYKPLFEKAKELFGENIFAYYYDIPFEETIKRHSTRSKSEEFGAEEMRRWWVEKDYIGYIHEIILTDDLTLQEAELMILNDLRSRCQG